MKGFVLLALAGATAVVLWVSAAGAAHTGGPLAQSAAATKLHIPLSKAAGLRPRSLKGVPSKGSYAFLLKLAVQPTGRVYNANLSLGKPAARAAAESQFATVRAAESRVTAALPSGSHVLYKMHAIMAGVGVYTNVKNLPSLQRISGVSHVYAIAPKKPSLSYSVYLEKAPQVWENLGDTGAGTSIAIIDTGVDYTHADFGGSGDPADYQTALADDTSAPTYPDPNKISTESADLVGDAYDASSDTPADTIPQPDPNPLDCNSHGTHTSGDAAGYGEDTTGATFTGDYTTLGSLTASQYQATFKIGPGMAPEAKLFEYKVFGCEGSTNVVAEALDMAADPNGDGNTSDHVDVASMSLGSDYGSPQDGDAVASNAASALGISVVAASGNGGDLYDVGGSPGDARDAIAVAASVDAYSQLDTLHVSAPAGDVGGYPAERSVAYDWANDPDLSGTVATLTDPGDVANQDGCDPINTDLTGKIAWLEWTDNDAARRCGSVARSANALAAGAIGAVFADDEDSFAAGITGSAVIPVVMVTKTAGDTLRPAAQAGTLTISGTSANDFEQDLPALDDEVAGFSSRGIRIAGDVKPDVSAVGVSVFSAGMGSGDDGLSDSGTSMATPEVAGLDALVRNQNSSWTPEEVKADIMNTAGQDLFTGDNHTGDKYAPGRVGAGRIDAKAALDNQVLAYVTDDPGAVSASFGTIQAAAPMTLHKTIKVANKSLTSATYDVGYQALTSVPGAAYSVSPTQVTVAGGASTTVTLTLTINPTQLTKTIDPTVAPLQGGVPREFLAEASGRVVFTPQGSSPTLRVPVYSAPRPVSTMTQPASIDMPAGAVQAGTLPLSGTGLNQGTGAATIQSIVSGFELQATSPALTGIPSDEKAADLKYVGTTSDAPQLTSIGDNPLAPGCNPDFQCGLEYFAISTQGPWHTAASQNEYDIYIDSTGDGVPDMVAFNTRLTDTDTLVVALLDLNTLDVVDLELINDRFGDTDTALFDSDTLVMPVFIPALPGVASGHSRITYGVVTFGQFQSSPVDSVGFNSGLTAFDGSLSTDVLNPGVAVFGSFDKNSSPLLWADMPGTSLTLRRDAASYATDHGKGALLVHFHNAVGNKAQVVDIDHHSLTVAKKGTGSGTVTSSPAGINCGSTCAGSFSIGAQVTLTATPAADSKFAGWAGGGCSGTGTCSVTISADTAVTATFTDKPPRVTSVKVKVNHKKRTAKATFRGTDPGHGSKGLRFKCKLDKKSFKNCRSPKLYKHLHKGKHTLQVKAIDRAGHVSKPVKKKFRV